MLGVFLGHIVAICGRKSAVPNSRRILVIGADVDEIIPVRQQQRAPLNPSPAALLDNSVAGDVDRPEMSPIDIAAIRIEEYGLAIG